MALNHVVIEGMKLQDYIDSEQMTPGAWARKVGIPQPIISRFLKGQRGLSLRTALKIQEITDGQVRVEELSR